MRVRLRAWALLPVLTTASAIKSAQIRVLAASTNAVDARVLFGGWGKLTKPSETGEALLCAVSGTDVVSGRDIVAVLDAPPQKSSGLVVEARPSMCFSKPEMSHGAAAQLPLLALTASAALHTVGLPPGRGSIGSSSSVGATVVIAGSSGRLPMLLYQLLAARGAKPCMAAQPAASEELGRLGVGEIVDHDRQSFTDLFGGEATDGVDAVLDCVGVELHNGEVLREQNGGTTTCRLSHVARWQVCTNDHVYPHPGAAYASLASPALRRLEQEGAFAVLRAAWGQRGSDEEHNEQSVWLADAAAAAAIAEVLTLIEEGNIEPPPEANLVRETWDQYMEFVSWARDTESGLRYGFPGPSMWPADEQLKW